MPSTRHSLGLALLLALPAMPGFVPVASAADKDEDRRALKMDELETKEEVSAEYKQAAEDARMLAIEKLEALLRESEEGDRKAGMMLRLSDLYFEQGKSDYADEMSRFTKLFDDCFNSGKTNCEELVKEDHTKSFGWYKRSIKLYESILRSYPRYAGADQATFYLGMTHQEMKSADEALEAFKKLVKLYPTSTFVPDSYIFIGEYYFDRNDAYPALRAYLKAASYTEHERYAYARYKLAWCYYNVEEYENAIGEMKGVVEYSMKQDPTTKKTAIRLEEEALKDLVRFFADAGMMDEAYEYFTKLGKKDLIRDMLKRLAGIYFDQGKFDQAALTFVTLIQESPNHPDNPGYQEQIVVAYRKMGQKDRALDELRRLRETYGANSAWARANASNPDALKDADRTIEGSLKLVATEFNKEARELDKAKHPRAKEAYEKAIEAYQSYFEQYNDDKRSYDLHFDFGELLWDRKRYEEAYDQYLKVVSLDPAGRSSRDAAESAIFAAEEMVKKEGGGAITTSSVKITKDIQPIPLTPWEQRLIESCKRYADLYKGDEKLEIIIYKSAFLLYQRFHLPEAAEQFRSVIARWPRSTNAERSAKLILDALAIREEWVSLRDTAKSFYSQEGLGSATFKKDMYDIYSRASLDVIQADYDKTKDTGKTADSYMAFYKEFPTFPENARLLQTTAAFYYQADRVADSMAVRHILIDDPAFGTKTPYYYEQVGALGYDYERLADFDKAIFYYDKLAELFPIEKDKLVKAIAAEKDAEKKKTLSTKLATIEQQAADALYTAAVFRGGLGDWQGGIARYENFLKLFPTDERLLDIRLAIANTYESQKKYPEAAAAFAAFYTTQHKDAGSDYTFYARLHQGRALLAQGKNDEARKVFTDSVDLYRKLAKGGAAPGQFSIFAAEMMFELAKPVFDGYAKLTIQGAIKDGSGLSGSALQSAIKRDDKATGDSLKAKTGALLELEKRYKEILDTGAGDWGLAALVSLGRAYENMADTLIKSPCPFYLTADQCDIYKLTLEDKAYPQTEKAVEVYFLGLEKAYELSLYNENTAYATRRLGDLRPADYPGLKEILPQRGLTAEKIRAFELEPSLK